MNGRTMLMVLAACLIAAGCSGSGGPTVTSTTATAASTATPGPTTTTTTQRPLVLVGHAQHISAATPLLSPFEVRLNVKPGRDDVVLFVVSALDGPMPQTREQIMALRGVPHGPSAILLVNTDKQPDRELRTLVVQETRDLLKQADQPGAADMPVLLGDDPNLILLIRGVANS